MPNQYPGGEKFHDTTAIDARLTELEQEKHQLIALREELQKSRPTPPVSGSFSPEQKIAMSRACTEYRVPHAVEISRSGNGAHLWIFFNDKVPANEARLLGFGLLDKAMEIYPNLSFDSYDRLFPNQ